MRGTRAKLPAFFALCFLACNEHRSRVLPADLMITIHDDGFDLRLDAAGNVELSGCARERRSWTVPRAEVESLAHLVDAFRSSPPAVRAFCFENPRFRTSVAVYFDGGTREASYSYDCIDSLTQRYHDLAGAVLRVSAASDVCPGIGAPPCILIAKKPSAEELLSMQGCNVCHKDRDESNPIAPSLVGIAQRKTVLTDGRVVTPDEAYLREAILRPMTHLVVGYPPSMPSFEGKLTKYQVDILIDYLLGKPSKKD